MRDIIIVSSLAALLALGACPKATAHPRPEQIGLPPSFIGAEAADEPFTNDDTLHFYDIQHYDLHVDFDLTGQTIAGDVSIHCVSTNDNLDEILLELLSLSVDSVQLDGITSDFTYHSDSLFIPLPVPLPEGDSVLVRVIYHGHPVHESWGGFWFQTQVTFSMGDGLYVYPPPYNHTWFPNWRHPADKATMEMWFTVPHGKVAASNGELVEVIENPPQQTVT
jgi:aminopeptidase N